jgi:protein gp37
VWKGVSAERQQEADERIPHLLQTPAAVRFMSCEPLLGPIDLTRIEAPEKVEGEHWTFDALAAGDMYYRRIERDFDPPLWDAADGPYRDHALGWIIVGGESGLGARPMHPQWARDLRDQCEAAGVAYFFKQWGTWTPCLYGRPHSCEVEHVFPDGQAMLPVSKRAAGRLLDGVEHNGMPEVRT